MMLEGSDTEMRSCISSIRAVCSWFKASTLQTQAARQQDGAVEVALGHDVRAMCIPSKIDSLGPVQITRLPKSRISGEYLGIQMELFSTGE